jgi:NADPH-dependent glutamate synthase beta subunit-like oxidoreductase
MKTADFDRSGRRRSIPIEGSEFTLSADSVIAAIGQSPDLSFIPGESSISINRWNCLDIAGGSKSQTTNNHTFAGGDAVTGPSTVIRAIAAGHQAAEDIDRTIREKNGEPPWEAPAEEAITIPFEIDEETEEKPQAAMSELVPQERKQSFAEVELGYDIDTAIKEASRCLRCDAEI